MKKFIPIGIILCYSIIIMALASCGTSRDIKRLNHFKGKLLSKGIVVPLDTLIVTNTDTLVQTFTVNDTTYIIKTVTETITLEPTVIVKTKWQTKIEYKERIKIVKEETKQEKAKQKTKRVVVRQENKKSKWWLFILIGLGLGIITPTIIKRFVSLR